MPILTLPRLLFSCLSLAIVGAGAYLLWSWTHGYDWRGVDGVWRHSRGSTWRLGAGAGLLAWSALGRFVILAGLARPAPADIERQPRQSGSLTLKDGSVVAYEISGRRNGPTLVFTHGWGLDRTVWAWVKRDLGQSFRLVTWDLPGLGASRGPGDGRFTIDRFAVALAAVIDAVSEEPVVVIGHSIGGMTTQTLFRAAPATAKAKVAGVVLLDTTYRNPVDTMWLSPLWRVLQKPVLEPLCWLTVALAPAIWLANWQSYWSGSAHLAMRLTGFGRQAPRNQVDLAARLSCQGSPAVLAKGNLAMFHWSVLDDLTRVTAPVLAICGASDIVTLPPASEVISHRVPRGDCLAVEGSGHMGFLDNFSRYNAAIRDFAETAMLGQGRSSPAAPPPMGIEPAGDVLH